MKKMIIPAVLVVALASCAAPAGATPGAYTRGGNVAVVLNTEGCASITWPKGYVHTECGQTTVIQGPIYAGDRFGASIVSPTGWAVSCRVFDVSTGDLVYSAWAPGGSTANCIRVAN
ncbi:hypothetical protein [Tsukamurella tyrosinosolvens]|uniref:hypothetical protein n=1 Tax=Tsukamurella tyrosinosolvens TaxID=57704 RepID=UPI002DD4473A|nr:hypothetical protein [Tsukamurella tyrosinosolvens]MEC4615835.1 hypothetical protein [Tsukamurella tyrosinosolvens]